MFKLFALPSPLLIGCALSVFAHTSLASGPTPSDQMVSSDFNSTVVPTVDGPASSGAGQGDVEPVNGANVGGVWVPWNGVVTLPASSALTFRDGKCVFDYAYWVANEGVAITPPTYNLIRRNATAGAVLDRTSMPPFKPGTFMTTTGAVALSPGTTMLYVIVDAPNRIIENNENDNIRRVTVQVTGTCAFPP